MIDFANRATSATGADGVSLGAMFRRSLVERHCDVTAGRLERALRAAGDARSQARRTGPDAALDAAIDSAGALIAECGSRWAGMADMPFVMRTLYDELCTAHSALRRLRATGVDTITRSDP